MDCKRDPCGKGVRATLFLLVCRYFKDVQLAKTQAPRMNIEDGEKVLSTLAHEAEEALRV